MLHHLDTERKEKGVEGEKRAREERKVQTRLGINNTKTLSGLRAEAEVGIILH